jgi:hypothetical protein
MTAQPEFRLSTRSERLAPDDERVTEAERALWRELTTQTDAARVEREGVPGSKGFTESLILSLVSSGALKMALDCLRGWLTRDPARVIELTRVVDGREERLVLRGTGLTDEALARFAAALGGTPGGPSR